MVQSIRRQLFGMRITPVFILVDGVDGYLETQELINMEGLVLPILNTLELIASAGIVWKFFFPDVLDNLVQSRAHAYQTGRLEIVPIRWDENSLRVFLHQRLLWASDGEIVEVTQQCEQDVILAIGDVDIELVRMALQHIRLGPPRALLRLANQLYHCGDRVQITTDDWDYFLTLAQKELVNVRHLLKGVSTDLDREKQFESLAYPPTNTEEDKPGSPVTFAPKKSLVVRILTCIFVFFPRVIGRAILDIFGRDKAADSSAILFGYVLIILATLVLWGILDLNSLQDWFVGWWRFFFPVE
jgi:hypothetical protein